MKWRKAKKQAMEKGCKDAVPVTEEAKNGVRPGKDQPSRVVCKAKIRMGVTPVDCDDECL